MNTPSEPTNDLPEEDVRFAPPDEENTFDPAHLDIDAALAAVASLDDMLAEQEAAEQARIAHAQAEAEARVQHQARVSHPEQFFPIPPLTNLQRGQIDSVVPALIFIGLGAWLTLSLTSGTTPAPEIMAGAALAGVAVILLIRWIAARRWAGGNLFFGLLLTGAALLLITGAGWPLLIVVVGIALALAGLLAQPAQRRLLLPGFLIVAAGAAAYWITSGRLL